MQICVVLLVSRELLMAGSEESNLPSDAQLYGDDTMGPAASFDAAGNPTGIRFDEYSFPSSSQGGLWAPATVEMGPSSDSLGGESDYEYRYQDTADDKKDEKDYRVREMRARCADTSQRPEWSISTTGRGAVVGRRGVQLSRQILNSLYTVRHQWCRLANLATTKSDGYAQVSYGGANKFAMLQELVLWSKGEEKPVVQPGRQTAHDVSHLCNQPLCTVPQHIVLETKARNNARKNCVPWAPCRLDCPDCSGEKVILTCQHGPQYCVLQNPKYESQQDMIESGICRDVTAQVRSFLDARDATPRGPSTSGG